MKGAEQPQLLMTVVGNAGSGKTHLVNTIAQMFAEELVEDWLVRAAPTGITASLVGGHMLHSLTRVDNTNNRLRLHRARYFVIDAVSLLTSDM
ncbi:hypothetical protein B0H11DRAFT_1741817, partial [Mycena galericulata]